MEIPAELWERAASALLAQDGAQDREAEALLAALDYRRSAADALDPPHAKLMREHRATLLKIAGKFKRVFQLHAPAAPGLACFGAQFSPELTGALHEGAPDMSVSGVGTTLQDGFQACIGEGIEFLSHLETGGESLETADPAEQLATFSAGSRAFLAELIEGNIPAGAKMTWCRGRRLADGGEVLLPADICLRRPQARRELSPPFLLGTGTAAGESFEAAALHGLLELIERDAAGVWWRGGRRARMIGLDDEGWQTANKLLIDLRRGASGRRSWLLDITTDVAVPCAAAISCSPDGFGFAFGLAARLTMREAMRSAILEMCQIELADAVVEAKRRARGASSLNGRDLAHLRRATSIDAERCELLHPLPPRPASVGESFVGSPPLQAIVHRLAALDIEVFAVDLRRASLNVPAARIIAPGLQLEPSEMTTPRLQAAILETGGGARHTKGERLL
ncbi:MAG: YcaO-like family protein [Hyphomicrobiales bacterium]